MKKIFLLLAFTGIVGASSANSIVSIVKPHELVVKGGDKDKKEKKEKKDKCSEKSMDSSKKCCKKPGKGCKKDEMNAPAGEKGITITKPEEKK